MFICLYTLIFTAFIFKNNFVNAKNDVLNNIHLIVDMAESLDIKFVVIFPLENLGNDSHLALSLLKNSKIFFTVCKTPELEFIKFAPFKTMVVYYPDSDGQNYCCSDLQFMNKFPLIIWFVITRDNILNMENVYVPYNCLFMVAQSEPNKKNFSITEKYQFHSDTKLYEYYLGFWSEENGLQLTNETFFGRRSNFHKESILVRPYHMIRAGAAGENIPYFIPGSWESVARRINASVKNTTNDSVYDLIVNFYLPEETQELPAVLVVRSMLYYKEEAAEISLDQYLEPFPVEVWLCLLSWLTLSAIGMFLVNKFKSLTNENFLFFILDSFYVFVQQGSQIVENASSFFPIKTLQLALSLFLFISYGSVFISYITISTFTKPFSDLEGILQDGRYNIITLPTRGYEAFKYSRPGVVRELFIKHVPPLDKLPQNFLEAFTELCEGKHKILVEIAKPLGPIVARSLPRPCRVNFVKFTTLKMGYQMSLNNRFKEVIKVCLTRMLESEAIGEIFWTKSLNIYKAKEEETADSITIVQVSSLLIMLLLGYFLTLTIFLLENLCYKKFKAKAKNNSSNYFKDDYYAYYNRRRNI